MRTALFPSSGQRDYFRPFHPPMTFIKCNNCGTVSSRPFQEGDYVFKNVQEKCPKCGADEMSIISIHVEDKARQTQSR